MPLIPSTVFESLSRNSENLLKMASSDLDVYPSKKLEALNLQAPEGFIVRPLKLADFENGYLELLAQLTEVGDVSVDEFKHRFLCMAFSNPQAYFITVIEDEKTKKIVASVSLVFEWKFIHKVGTRGRIEDVVVDKEYRGKGFAKLLNELAVQLAKNEGVYKLSLECTDELIPFYEKFGYKKDVNFLVLRF
ncbi:unnamed protein product [Bursaphelenchus xylophilus]|uniref:Glucosamine 6-phosphate N-acetyltransferase n=1 Tax=Bursaphelenchus xylophilus TaxID=6326 RepID=A0A1I7RPP4_BURXY|nr:unnamed protein product [Bursaphelenchus xylophilus]CAG9096390.1 unnamed protein product [Bursaphelenchus xylophilus]